MQESIKEMADKLLKLYTDRFMAKGYAYPPIPFGRKSLMKRSSMRRPLRAIHEIKRIWNGPPPWTGPLRGCGLRQDRGGNAGGVSGYRRKQVAVLVPTTILAQHFQTFINGLVVIRQYRTVKPFSVPADRKEERVKKRDA